MAKVKSSSGGSIYAPKTTKRGKAKKSSVHKTSKYYVKPYRGQGR